MSKGPTKKVFQHLQGLQVKAVFSDCCNYRYLLKIKKLGVVPGKRVCVIMLNPSVASEKQADKSVQFLEKLIFEKVAPHFSEVSELWIVNLYAYVQTRYFKGMPEQVGEQNDHYLDTAIAAADIVLLAWGKTCSHPDRQAKVMELLSNYPEKVLLVTRRHPSRGQYENFVAEFKP